MPAIEFLDDDGNVLDDPADEVGPPPPVDRPGGLLAALGGRSGPVPGRVAALAPPVLWVAAAVVAVVACFQRVYGERIVSGATYVQAADGWGRYTHRDDVSVPEHSIRYGVLVCVAAGVLAAAAALHLLRRRGAAPVALFGAAALLGCVATVWLSVNTQFAVVEAAFHRQGMLRPQVLELRYGPFTALGVVAACIAGLGCAVATVAARVTGRPAVAPGEAQFTPAEGHQEVPEELLATRNG